MAYLFCVLAALLWGFVYAVDEKLLKTLTPNAIIFVNGVLALAFSAAVFAYRGFNVQKFLGQEADAKTMGITFAAHSLTIVASFFAFSAIVKIGSSTAAMLEISYPFFVILFSWLLFNQTISKEVLIGGILIFIGCLLIFSK